MILSMGIYQGHSVLVGARMIALQGLHFDLPCLDEFRGKNDFFSIGIIHYLLHCYRLQ